MNPIGKVSVSALASFAISISLVAFEAKPPNAKIPTATEQQLRWHAMEFYGLLHFGPNTFLDQEWSYGDASPRVFNPSQFNAE